METRNGPARPTAEHRRVFDLIWSQMPSMQNPTSSSWWFFLLLPKQAEGYGPKQMMFFLGTRVGESLRVNDVWMPGLDLGRRIDDGTDRFDTMAISWFHDGERMHDDIVKQASPTTLSQDGYIESWSEQPDGTRHGGTIRAAPDHPLALEAHFRGAGGEARFVAEADLASLITSPDESINYDSVVGGTHFLAWRYMRFKGEFSGPGGTETQEGLCYFQRVCLNVPIFPWKWYWTMFADGTLFSGFMAYAGPQVLRRRYGFLPQWLEQVGIPILPSAFVSEPGGGASHEFDVLRVTPLVGAGEYPQFIVEGRSKNGDYLRMRTETFGHTHIDMDRPVLKKRLTTHWSYNEYLFRTRDVEGRVAGRELNERTLGPGYGNLEYTWGLGL